MRILITGTSGFIGTPLAHLLAVAGHDVLGIDKAPPRAGSTYSHQTVDLLDRPGLVDCFKTFQPEALIHLAARTDVSSDPTTSYRANIGGVENLVEAIRAARSVKRAICTSTQLVCRLGYIPQHDQDYAPSTTYGESKIRTEQIWRAADGGGTTWCITRPTTIWGPGMNPGYSPFFQMIQSGRYFHIGYKPLRKSYGFVGNTIKQYESLLSAPVDAIHRRVFYLADYTPLDIRDWANAFQRELAAPAIRSVPMTVAVAAARMGDVAQRVTQRPMPINSYRLQNMRTEYVHDMARTEAVCGPLPFTLEDGVKQTAAWLRQDLKHAS